MAERVGFEPTIPVKVCPLSRRIVSTTHAPLRRKQLAIGCQLKQIPHRAFGPVRNDKELRIARFYCSNWVRISLAAVSEERLQQFCAPSREDAAADFDPAI